VVSPLSLGSVSLVSLGGISLMSLGGVAGLGGCLGGV